MQAGTIPAYRGPALERDPTSIRHSRDALVIIGKSISLFNKRCR